MTGPPIENYEALDASAQIGDRGAKGVITLLTERGLVAISMQVRCIDAAHQHWCDTLPQKKESNQASEHKEITPKPARIPVWHVMTIKKLWR